MHQVPTVQIMKKTDPCLRITYLTFYIKSNGNYIYSLIFFLTPIFVD